MCRVEIVESDSLVVAGRDEASAELLDTHDGRLMSLESTWSSVGVDVEIVFVSLLSCLFVFVCLVDAENGHLRLDVVTPDQQVRLATPIHE